MLSRRFRTYFLLLVLCRRFGVCKVRSGDKVELSTRAGLRIVVDEGHIAAVHPVRVSLADVFVIEGAQQGVIHSGDIVFLKNRAGSYIDVNGTAVEARWNDKGSWQRLVVLVGSGFRTTISSGDTVFLRAHTGMYLDVEDGNLQARWPDQGDWQAFRIHDVDEEQSSSDLFHGALDSLGAGCGFPKDAPRIECREFMETDCTTPQSLQKVCPARCPFLAPHPQLRCFFECTEPALCSASNPETAFANNETSVCEECNIVGCRRCDSQRTCAECFNDFALEFGGRTCLYVWDERAKHGVHLTAAVALVISLLASVVIVILDHCACCGRCLPRETEETEAFAGHGCASVDSAIRQARLHRARCKIRGTGLVRDNHSCSNPLSSSRQGFDAHYLLFNRLPLWINLRQQFLAGVGLPLFHQWYGFLLLYSVLMTVGTFWVYRYSELGGVLQKTGLDHATDVLHGADAMSVCGLRARNHDQVGDSVRAFALRAFVVYLVLWVLGFALSIGHAIRQRRIAEQFYQDHPCLAEFAVAVEGFPADATDEEGIRKFMREAFRTSVLDVSVCYDYRAQKKQVHELLERILVAEDLGAGTYDPSLAPAGTRLTNEELRRVRSWLTLRNSGQVFAIFQHNYDLQLCRRRFEAELEARWSRVGTASAPAPPTLPHEVTPRWLPAGCKPLVWIGHDGAMHELTLRDVACEPPDVVWENLGTSWGRLVFGHCAASLAVIASFALMAAGLFVPLASYSINYMMQAGSFPTGVMMSLLGALVMAANWVMCFIHSSVSTFVGHSRRDREGLLLLKAFAVLCLINFLFNVTIALFPESQAHALEYISRPLGSGLLTLQGVVFQARLASQMSHILVPGALFIGYMLWPLQGFVWPFVSSLACLRLKYRFSRRIPAREAELALEPLRVSLPHDYMGTIVQPVSCNVLLFFASDVAWQTFACLAGWSIFMMVFMRHLHLREVRRFYCTTNRLDTDVLFLWGFPLSMVLAASFFWIVRLRGWPLYLVPITWVFGVSLYFVTLAHCVRPLTLPKSEGHACHRPSYDEVRAMRHYDWHNCNPIKVLLSHCSPDAHKRALAPFQAGKEYLQARSDSRQKSPRISPFEPRSAQLATDEVEDGWLPRDLVPEVDTLVAGPIEVLRALQQRMSQHLPRVSSRSKTQHDVVESQAALVPEADDDVFDFSHDIDGVSSRPLPEAEGLRRTGWDPL